MFTHTYPHKARRKTKVTVCNHQADSPLYVLTDHVMSDLVMCKFRKSMVIHDAEWFYWDQVSLNNTDWQLILASTCSNVQISIIWTSIFVKTIYDAKLSKTWIWICFIMSSWLVRVSDGKMFGYGFVQFKSVEEADKALKKMNGKAILGELQ